MPDIQRVGTAALKNRSAPSRLAYPGSPGGLAMLGSGPGYANQSLIAGLGGHRFLTLGIPGPGEPSSTSESALVASTYGLPTPSGESSLIASSTGDPNIRWGQAQALSLLSLDANRALALVYENGVNGQSWVTVIYCADEIPLISVDSAALIRTGSMGPGPGNWWYHYGSANFDCLLALPDGNALYCTTVQVPYSNGPCNAAILPLTISGNTVMIGEWQIAPSPLHVTSGWNIPAGGAGIIGTRAYFAVYNPNGVLSLIVYDYVTQSFVTDTGDTPVLTSNVSVSRNGTFEGFFTIVGGPTASYGQVFFSSYGVATVFAIDDTVVDGTVGPSMTTEMQTHGSADFVLPGFTSGVSSVAPMRGSYTLLTVVNYTELTAGTWHNVPMLLGMPVVLGDMTNPATTIIGSDAVGYLSDLVMVSPQMLFPPAVTAEGDVVVNVSFVSPTNGPYYSYAESDVACAFAQVDYLPPRSGNRPKMPHGPLAQASKFDPRRASFL